MTIRQVKTMIPDTMRAVLLKGHGGYEQLELRDDVPVPLPGPGDALIRVAAAAINNTDINSRIGWYSRSVTGATSSGGEKGYEDLDARDAAWSRSPLGFPRIQGVDVCGVIAAVGEGVLQSRIGERVLISSLLHSLATEKQRMVWLGIDHDGGFAEYCTVPAVDTCVVDCDWSDAELASIPCAFSTAENALQRVGLQSAETILISGASGGVGTAAVQLAKRRGAQVIGISGAAKAADVQSLGADRTIDRRVDLLSALEPESVDVVFDVAAGSQWPKLLDVLRPGGRYVTVGAIAGPMVELDVRTLYLKDLLLTGCTLQVPSVFTDLVGYIERGEIRPVIAAEFPLDEIVTAQKAFLSKQHTGKIVLIP